MLSSILGPLLAISLAITGAGGKDAMNKPPSYGEIGIEFGDSAETAWRPVNDGVMGGLSRSGMVLSGAGTAIFEGIVSLENNGGFASVRTTIGEIDMSSDTGLAIRVKGDGKRYRLRLRTDRRFDGVAYQAHFDAGNGEWVTIHIPFSSFVPTFRGRLLADQPPLDTATICQIGLMIADKQDGPFRLEIEWIRAYRLH